MRKQLLLIIAFLVIFSGCAKKEPIRIGVNSWPPCEIWYVAQEKKFFNGVDVKLVRFSEWTDNMKSLYKGNTDITHSSYFNSVFYHGRGEAGKIFLITDYILGGDGLVAKKNINSIKELKGKKIAVEINTDEHFLLYKALVSNNVSINDVEIISTTSKNAMKRFISGEVDAAFTYEPYLSDAAKKGTGKILTTSNDMKGYLVDVLVGNAELLKNRKGDYLKIVKAWYKAQEYIKKHPDEAMEIMAKNEEMPASDFKSFYDSFTFIGYDENKKLIGSKEFKEKLAEMGDFLVKTNIKKIDTNIDEIYSRIFK